MVGLPQEEWTLQDQLIFGWSLGWTLRRASKRQPEGERGGEAETHRP